jgi:GAF domain-containing protein
VFEAIVASANRLIGGFSTAMFRFVDDQIHLSAFTPTDPAGDAVLQSSFPMPSGKFPPYHLVLNGAPAELVDTELEPAARDIARARGYRSMLFAPLMNEGKAVGIITVTRRTPGAFGEPHVGLLQMFAAQSVIAIENVRLFNETREALEQQKASADILRVVSSSVADAQPVFDEILRSIEHLFGGDERFIYLAGDDGLLHVAAAHGANAERVRALYPVPLKGTASEVAFRERRLIRYADVFNDPEVPSGVREIARRIGHNYSMALAPMLWEDRAIGSIFVGRTSMKAFSEKECSLLRSFADQAVIAIQNARLFNEVRQRTEDLSESLQQQTATADVLKVISRSAFDLPSVLDTLVTSAALLCGDPRASIYLLRDGLLHLEAAHNNSAEWIAQRRSQPLAPSRDTPSGRAALTGQLDHVPDLLTDPDFSRPDLAQLGDYRATLNVPMTREGVTVGVLSLARPTPGPFTQRQVELVQTFADQAVIAIENVRLFDEVQARTRDLTEALEYQTAIGDVLNVISRSPNNLQPVIETIVHTARRLCQSEYALMLHREDDGVYRIAAHSNASKELMDWMQDNPVVAGDGSAVGIVAAEKQTVHLPDALADPRFTDLRRQRHSKARTMLGVPLLRGQEVIGVVFLARTEVKPFSDKQIELVTNFADQALIAIENVRLFDEVQAKTADLSESLQQQTATADVLKVISRSAFDLQTVLDTLVESAARLCEADMAAITRRIGDAYYRAGSYGFPPEFVAYARATPVQADRHTITGRTLLEGRIVHVDDVLTDPEYDFEAQQLSGNPRTFLGVPLLREGTPIGALTLTRSVVRPFTDTQIELIATFADQAVIAIENVRLFDEVQAKTRDLSEALTYQTGSGNILRVIASSPTDVKPVLTAIVESACELCEADDALATLRDGDELVFQAQHGSIPVVWDRQPIDREGAAGLAVIDRAPVHVHDLLAPEGERFPRAREFARTTNVRTVLCVPLLREGESIGAIVLRRTEVRPFSDKQISLLQTFADQAVIAIGNVRLFEEVQQRTRELSESLEQQTATSEVLSVISRSAGDLEPVFQSMLENATRICGAQFGLMNLYDGDSFHTVGFHNVPAEFEAARQQRFRAHPDGDLGQMVHTKQVVHIHDLRTRPLYIQGDPATVQLAELAGARTILIVPMVKDDEFVGTIGIYRLEVSPFNEKQIALLSSFASQAVIAIENTRLLKELRERTDDLTKSLDDLRTAQDRLVQTEKLASLGQLTAGIAHEIKNPLNFVNNFAAVSAELTDELNDVLKLTEISDKVRGEVDELTGLLKDNLQKVVQHGKRADSIVKNMLLHSREGSGDHRPTDINALIDESLNLAYHGARAERPDFNVTLQRDFDASAGMVELFPQEITRVFLNLVSNGFYAVNRRRIEGGQSEYDPVLSAATRNLGDAVEIRIRDNGTGIPQDVKDKMFNPFFTTKPAGEGTGLGLSMSHDIIVKQHGGTIDVETEPGQFTEFRIVLPRTSNPPDKNRG